MNNHNIISATDLNKTFGELKVVKGVNLDVKKGEFISIAGKSGSGKTTLLSLLSGLERPSSGRVTLNGRDITESSENELALFRRDTVGFIFQSFHLIPTLSAWENHEIGILKAVGWTQQEIQKQLTAEAFVQTLAGGVLGILIGYVISFLLGFLSITIPVPWELNPVPAMAKQAQAANQVVRLPVSVSLSLALRALGLSVIIGCISGYILGLRTAKIRPAEILRQL